MLIAIYAVTYRIQSAAQQWVLRPGGMEMTCRVLDTLISRQAGTRPPGDDYEGAEVGDGAREDLIGPVG